MGILEKIVVRFFILFLKTKRIAKSAIRGRINYQAKIVAPYLLGALIAVWMFYISVN